MKPSQILILEDQVMTINILKLHLSEWGYQIAGAARTLEDALAIVAVSPPDLALLDIDLGKGRRREGIELAHRLRQQYAFPIIFLTAQSDLQTMREAQATEPDAFLSKPFTEGSLAFAIESALKKASDRLTKPQPLQDPVMQPESEDGTYYLLSDHLFVRKGHTHVKLPVGDILWIQADRQYSQIHTASENYVVSTNLGNFSRQFEHDSLLRVSRSHIINIHHIDGFEGQNVVIVAGQVIPIHADYQERVLSRFRFLKTTRGN